LAKRYTADATQHATTANTLSRHKDRPSGRALRQLGQIVQDAAKEATAAAEMHRQLAGVGR